MSDKIDLAEIEHLGHLFVLDREIVALVRAVRAAAAYFNHLENEGFCAHTVTLPDGGEACSIVEDMRSALAAFTDSAEVRDDG